MALDFYELCSRFWRSGNDNVSEQQRLPKDERGETRCRESVCQEREIRIWPKPCHFLIKYPRSRSPKDAASFIRERQLLRYVTTQKMNDSREWITVELSLQYLSLPPVKSQLSPALFSNSRLFSNPLRWRTDYTLFTIYASSIYTCCALLIVFRLFICKLGAITSRNIKKKKKKKTPTAFWRPSRD